MHAVALAARKVADFLLLVGALEIEAGDVRPGVHLALAHLERVVAAGDFLVDRVGRRESIAVLVDVAQLDGRADANLAAVGLLLADDHAKQRGLADAVGADDAHDAAGRQAEAEVVDQQLVAITLGEVLGLDHQVAQVLARRDLDLQLLVAVLLLLGWTVLRRP